MFESFNRERQELLFTALRNLIETGAQDGKCFHNGDPGHDIYIKGAQGTTPQKNDSDSPDKNILFQMISELSKNIKASEDIGYTWWRDLSTWQKFCEFVAECYKKRKE